MPPIGLDEGARLGRNGGRRFRLEQGNRDDIQNVQPRQGKARQKGALVHVADGTAQLVGQHDQHQRRRDDLRQRAGRRNHPGGQTTIIAIAQHDGQRNQSHRDHRGRHHARGGRQHRPHQDDRDRQAAAQWPEQLPDCFQQVLGHAGTFQNQTHEGEKGHRQQGFIAHHAEHALRQGLEQGRGQQPQINADQTEQNAVGRQGKRHRKTQQQQDHQHAEHDRRHIGQ